MPHNKLSRLRGEIRPDFPRIRKQLSVLGFRRANATRRLSVMFFGVVHGYRKGGNTGGKEHVDLRCRITNGDAEIVTKVGKDVTSRLEIRRAVSHEDLVAFSQMFAAMGFFGKVGSKLTENFQHGSILISLVQSPSGLAYIELEKMTDQNNERKDRKELVRVARAIDVRIWKSQKEFRAFCDQLTTQDDWKYCGSPADVKRLKREIYGMGFKKSKSKNTRHEMSDS